MVMILSSADCRAARRLVKMFDEDRERALSDYDDLSIDRHCFLKQTSPQNM